MQITDLKQDKRNYRKHNERNLSLIKKSIEEVGFGRSVVIDNNNEIVCGNGLVSQLEKNTPVKVIETDGSELVVVKRTDLAPDDEKDLSKADCSVNIYCFIKAQETGQAQKAVCSIGDKQVNINGKLVDFTEIVEVARKYINNLGSFEKLAEWGLR